MVKRKAIILLWVMFLPVLSLFAKLLYDGQSLDYYPLGIDLFVVAVALLVPKLTRNTPGSIRR